MSVAPPAASSVIPGTRILLTAASNAHDSGRVRLGAGMKAAPAIALSRIADSNRVRLGAGMKALPATTLSRVADSGRVRLGAGMRRF